MVAISLYRGNLHRVPDVPRRWLLPTPKISIKSFRVLLNRRFVALAGLHHSLPATSIATTSKPNPNLKEGDENIFTGNDSLPPPPQSDPPEITVALPQEEEPVEEASEKGTEGVDDSTRKPIDGPDALHDTKAEAPEFAANPVNTDGNSHDDEKPPETSNEVDALSDAVKRKKEIEEKLQVLNAKKHDFVQVLKQILSAEEELKRRNSTQGMGMRTSVPLQVDVTNDSGSMTRLTTPRLGSEGNLGSDIERGEADDIVNQNTHSRHLLRTSSTSPSSDSLHKRPTFSAAPHPRASLGVVGSPSRFAPVGHPPNLPTVSVSGMNYIASSPSPAASGGTSAFRDSRQPSPWN